jgi:hypothetical protein
MKNFPFIYAKTLALSRGALRALNLPSRVLLVPCWQSEPAASARPFPSHWAASGLRSIPAGGCCYLSRHRGLISLSLACRCSLQCESVATRKAVTAVMTAVAEGRAL